MKTNPPNIQINEKHGKTHRHGGSPGEDFYRLGVTPGPVKDFSVNINPLGPPEAIFENWTRLQQAVTAYPTIDGNGVRRFYEQRFGLKPDSVLPGNGSIELIYLVPQALGLKNIFILSPCFHDYQRAAQMAGAAVAALPLSAENGFAAPSIETIEEHLARADAFCVGNPNNPTGTRLARSTLLHLAEKYPEKTFMVDEAFVQFVAESGQTSLLDRKYLRPNLIVFHSLTKFYALPGLRLGAAVSHPDTVGRLAAVKEPWTVNGIAEKAAEMLCCCRDYEKNTTDLIAGERQRFLHQLNNIPHIRFLSPTANFFLAQWKGSKNLDDLLRWLLTRGIYVRDCRNFPGLEDNFFRFCIQTPQDNDRFTAVLTAYTEGPNG